LKVPHNGIENWVRTNYVADWFPKGPRHRLNVYTAPFLNGCDIKVSDGRVGRRGVRCLSKHGKVTINWAEHAQKVWAEELDAMLRGERPHCADFTSCQSWWILAAASGCYTDETGFAESEPCADMVLRNQEFEMTFTIADLEKDLATGFRLPMNGEFSLERLKKYLERLLIETNPAAAQIAAEKRVALLERIQKWLVGHINAQIQAGQSAPNSNELGVKIRSAAADITVLQTILPTIGQTIDTRWAGKIEQLESRKQRLKEAEAREKERQAAREAKAHAKDEVKAICKLAALLSDVTLSISCCKSACKDAWECSASGASSNAIGPYLSQRGCYR
jgi:hypothetical protein